MRTILILMDSLNRHLLRCYNPQSPIPTPNIDRLAARGVVFDNHWCGSMPCMPARRELMTGRLNFLEGPWGPIEPWDVCGLKKLREERGTYSHLITDHYHYFHAGGEGYYDLFSSWELERGQEGDRWRGVVNPPPPPPLEPGRKIRGLTRHAYWANRACMDLEDDLSYPTPRCFQRAIEFVERNHAADNWHLHLEVFDPHEPFDCPTRYRQQCGDTWTRPFFTWPEYAPLDPAMDDPETVAHIRACYAGTLAMADAWMGRFLDAMDAHDMWKDTTVIFTTDHGHLLGEHGYWAKNYMEVYRELANIPLVVCQPQVLPSRRTVALTATVDVLPTLMDLHGAAPLAAAHGRSMLPVVAADGPHHDAVLFGYFASDVNLFDGRHFYCRQPIAGAPCHHHTLMPRGFADFLPAAQLAQAEFGFFLPRSPGIPQLRLTVPSRRHYAASACNPLYDLQADPDQQHPLHDSELEQRMAGRLVELLQRHDAPPCHYPRLGLAMF